MFFSLCCFDMISGSIGSSCQGKTFFSFAAFSRAALTALFLNLHVSRSRREDRTDEKKFFLFRSPTYLSRYLVRLSRLEVIRGSKTRERIDPAGTETGTPSSHKLPTHSLTPNSKLHTSTHVLSPSGSSGPSVYHLSYLLQRCGNLEGVTQSE